MHILVLLVLDQKNDARGFCGLSQVDVCACNDVCSVFDRKSVGGICKFVETLHYERGLFSPQAGMDPNVLHCIAHADPNHQKLVRPIKKCFDDRFSQSRVE